MTKVKTITVTNESTSSSETIPAAISLIYYNDKNNLNIATDSTDVNSTTGKGGKINIEAASDILFKPGDDIIMYSHHRASGSQDEVAIKAVQSIKSSTDAAEVDRPVKLQLNIANLTVTTKDKNLSKTYNKLTTDATTGDSVPASGATTDSTSSEDEIFDVNINTGKSGSSDNKKGYLKVRARAIDLRCEEHGGIALLPKGTDGTFENKVKFEHGGGDGLEFFTMNTDKTSMFTNEYRFNKDGVWKMATRTTETSDKADSNDSTTLKKYVKQSDDFYDIVDDDDETATTNDIIKTANAFNGGKDRHVKMTSSNNLEIATVKSYKFTAVTEGTATVDLSSTSFVASDIFNSGDFTDLSLDAPVVDTLYKLADGNVYKCEENTDPKIKIESSSDIELNSSSDIIINTGSGDTDYLNISDCPKIYAEYKISKKGAILGSDPVFISAVTNNIKDNDNTYSGDIATNMTQALYDAAKLGPDTSTAQCTLSDIVKLVNYMKTNEQGPWASSQTEGEQ